MDIAKSLNFLSHNKSYTAINIFGLTVALMFVVLIGAYVWQERSIDHQHAKADRILVSAIDFGDGKGSILGSHHILQKQLRAMYPGVESSCGVAMMTMRISKGDEYVSTTALVADSTFFNLFDYPLLEGDRATCLATASDAVITRGLARKLFGDEPAVGKTITYADGVKLKVTGVMADLDHTIFDNPQMVTGFDNLHHGGNAALTDQVFERGIINITGSMVFFLMKEGATFVGHEREVTKHLVDGPWKNMEGWDLTFTFVPLSEMYSGGYEVANGVVTTANTQLINILTGVGIAILLFSLMNYVNLTVALSGRRSREMAARRLFGASRWAVAERMMGESLLLCLVSFALAVALALAFAPTFGGIIGTRMNMALLAQPQVVAAMVGVWLLIGVVSGAVPALLMSRVKPVEIFRGTFAHQTKMVFSRVFITVQNVITIVLLACAATMLFQVRTLVNAPMGYDREGVLVCQLGWQSQEDKEAFAARLRQQPFVKSVSLSCGTPMDGGNNNTVNGDAKGAAYSFQILVADRYFCDVYGLRPKDGFQPQPGRYYLDRRAIAAAKESPAALGSPEEFRFFAGDSLTYGGQVEDFAIRTIEEQPHPLAVVLMRQLPYCWTVNIRLVGDLADGYERVGKLYKEVFHEEMDADRCQFADKMVRDQFEDSLRMSHVVSMFAVVAIVISVLGLVAMSTYFIQQRSKEVALRKVFGSTGGQVRRRLVRSFLSYVALAFVVAVPLTWWFMADWLSRFTHRVAWWPWLVASGLAVLAVSYAAVAVQSHVAAMENPVKHVKDE